MTGNGNRKDDWCIAATTNTTLLSICRCGYCNWLQWLKQPLLLRIVSHTTLRWLLEWSVGGWDKGIAAALLMPLFLDRRVWCVKFSYL